MWGYSSSSWKQPGPYDPPSGGLGLPTGRQAPLQSDPLLCLVWVGLLCLLAG